MAAVRRGVWAAIASNVLFAALFLYSSWMQPMNGTEVFAWRMVAMLLGLMVLMSAMGMWAELLGFVRQMGRDRVRWCWVMLPTPILASQLWLFMWAPVNGEGVNVAMGYFLFPLAMLLGGWLWFKERLSGWQRLAVGLAVVGVAYELWRTAAFSWTTLWVCGTYPVYYLLRRALKVPVLVGLFLDLLLIAPVMLVWLLWQSDSFALLVQQPMLLGLVVLLGINSTLAMFLNLWASQKLPVSLFGMLSYLEPILLFVVSLWVLREPLEEGEWVGYGLIWLGLCVMALEGVLLWYRHRHKPVLL